MQVTQWSKWWGLGAILVIGASGCADRNNNGQPDSVATTSEIDKSMGNTDEKLAAGADKVGDELTQAADKTGDLVSNAATSTKIKSAIVANDRIDSTLINVDTKGNTVYLKGSVKNAAQSKLVEQIARKNADSVKVVNQLKVTGNTAATMKKS
jgi:osmotically-inducible protein OsmY